MSHGRADRPASPALPRRLLFTITIFAGSFLLFLIQPMMARMALPRLGGAPAVWNSAMLVYQALLLGGYAYAHWLARQVPRTQVLIHLSLLLAAALFLPIGLAAAAPPSGGSLFIWVPWLFLASIGPLFFIVSAQAPLLQHWFAASGGEDPYPLYAASNLGSFAGLLAYPLLLEPLTGVRTQSLIWTVGYALLFLLILGCAARVGKTGGVAPVRAEPLERLKRASIAKWVWFAFIPSGLMLSTSLFITTDLMAVPLLWVLPLGLYLLSFSIAFAARSGPAELLSAVAPYLLVPAAASLFIGERIPLAVRIAILLLALFAIAVACHFEVYRNRPHPRQLTGFYLALSVGGVLGGIFSALIAPLVFDWTYEYPLLLLAAAATLLPRIPLVPWSEWLQRPAARTAIAGLPALMVAGAIWASNLPEKDVLVRYGTLAALVTGSIAVGSRTLLTGTMLALMIVAGGWDRLQLSASTDRMIRTYFGVYSIVDRDDSRRLMHGTTLHGVQLLKRGEERTPTTYYVRQSGVGRALQAAPNMFGPKAGISVVGLGTGTLACYRQPGQSWTFFELDPAVVSLATDNRHFSFLARCAPDARIVVGDARLKLAEGAQGTADVLVVDAFSSDAVPMHLLTQEAFEVYGRHLKPDGLLLMHISNRHLDLEPVVAAAPGWTALVGEFSPNRQSAQLVGSDWMALSRSPETLGRLVEITDDSFWEGSTRTPLLWSDDHASLLSVLK